MATATPIELGIELAPYNHNLYAAGIALDTERRTIERMLTAARQRRARPPARDPDPGPLEVWSARRLTALVPHTTRKLWLTSLVPALVKAGALTKHGKHWLGRRSTIEATLHPTKGNRS